MKRILTILIVCAVAFAADINKPDSSTTPTVPIDVAAEYYRTDAAVAHLKPVWDAANVDLQQAVAKLKAVCGDKYEPAPTKDGKALMCKAK
jgi:hypothetical protein